MITFLQQSRNAKKSFLFELFLGVLTAVLFSTFLYLEHYGITLKIINTLFGLTALTLFLYMPKRAVLIAGFLIGLAWFYWIGYSFKYQGVGFMTPFITLGFALVYMLFFGVLALTHKVYLRALLLFGLSFVEPFDFNWMQIELIFVDSYIGVFKYQLALVLLALTLPDYIKAQWKYTPLFLLIAAFNFYTPVQKDTPLKIKLVATHMLQEEKWQRENLSGTITMVYKEIEYARDEGYDVVVLPESVFPLYMNKNPQIMDTLLQYSYDISIVTGSLLYEENQNYNVTYMFQNGVYEVAKKMVLVPFGEYIPLPNFAKKIINDTFFAGASDFTGADKPTDFLIKGVKFRNAVCYEATCSELYEGEVDFMVAISNNAWFAPSIEPTLQKLLMRYYARKNGVTIYHSANSSGTGVVK
ncbi:MAG: apolipoprotein N-acyltransferase [Sulfurimonas sp.]|nr:apolipoprotein N-acyltransferase [Sulfurimonas sp.]MBU3939845.1 apolipoprotein N-acyltransferase [bacterium]MBU4025042.1 apolipoprotein N-acyltransferase [bacterium]MBU4059731.1 apolipoprotein N-acyltransferase [bacterium]